VQKTTWQLHESLKWEAAVIYLVQRSASCSVNPDAQLHATFQTHPIFFASSIAKDTAADRRSLSK
jgi:hypothetical protein